MSRIDFYHLQKQSADEVLPKLLSKAYATGKRIAVKTPTGSVETVNALLWTFDDESFLPHGSSKDGFSAEQPIFITDNDENINEAAFLFLVNGAETAADNLPQYERVFNIFDGNSEEALQQARQLWKTYKDSGCEVCYWQQSARGTWEQKA